MTDNVIKMPPRFTVEIELADALKETLYKFAQRLSVVQVIGCLELVKQELYQEQAK